MVNFNIDYIAIRDLIIQARVVVDQEGYWTGDSEEPGLIDTYIPMDTPAYTWANRALALALKVARILDRAMTEYHDVLMIEGIEEE
jgi:hypothetical protein